jgi:acetyl-CoA synthetase
MATKTIESVLQETRVFPPSAAFTKQANISGMEAYRKLCAEAERDFTGFWGRLAKEELLWHKPFTRVLDDSKAPFYKWFDDGELNASYNSLDRHLKTQPDKTAIIFEADDGKVTRITYKALYHEVCKFANALKTLGVAKGDRVTIYMPLTPEAAIAMLACARIGAVHSVIFGGFSADAVADRNNDAGAKMVITADGGWRRGKIVALKANVDAALEKSPLAGA